MKPKIGNRERTESFIEAESQLWQGNYRIKVKNDINVIFSMDLPIYNRLNIIRKRAVRRVRKNGDVLINTIHDLY